MGLKPNPKPPKERLQECKDALKAVRIKQQGGKK